MITRAWSTKARVRALIGTVIVVASSLGLTTTTSAAPTTSGPLTPAALNGTGYHALASPVRVLDTRTAIGGINGPIPPNSTITVTISPRIGIAVADVSAVIMNVTVVDPTGTGYVSVFPAGSGAPSVSSVNFQAGRTTPNLVTVRVRPSDGAVSVFNFGGSAQLLFDVVGWFGNGSSDPSGTEYVSTNPVRLYDSRTNALAAAGGLAPGKAFTLTTGDPAEYSSEVYNVTITGAQGAGYVSVYPGDASQPNASNLNVTPGRDVANTVVVRRGNDAGRSITVFNGTSGYLHFIVDESGAFYTGPLAVGGIFQGTTPFRGYDTRIPGQSSGIIAAGEVNARRINIAGSVPANATSIVLNLTVTDPTTAGYASIFPGTTWPGSSTVNYDANGATANIAIVKLPPADANGARTLSILIGSGFANVIIDVFGWYQ